ncbi:prepilin-type N-terminal cleavage/methylation domain-containing protein [Lichenicola cladoniae]|uniref:Prepilin-type N-terminal cleavage/methylation domain-containing protein n=1 Tax=Lichenicola cladoniae TaxID=1484109 RepID=A0A6M8HUN0_9PROT|nr:prepilin-type N-terminal cleavage/methylation domain-containing protein [Lichenicola cladoniae]NPD66200.1 prepilin-type N-terminal cleavage/methylation domain-containing protein [Acetobacteraceae bacterium]QKE92062.1 prepilin-type N-terminal cleavage/methylation domain-containing protein [Lichenicola cladoniae]
MRVRARAAGDAGFTLLEIIVALVVLGILLSTLTRGVQFGLAAFDRQDRMIQTGGRLEAVDRTLRRLIEQLDPGTSTDGDTVAGGQHVLVFRSPLRLAGSSKPGDPQTDGLLNLRLSVDSGHRLILTWSPYRHVIPTGPAPKPHDDVLMTGVDRIDISYFAEGGWHTRWRQPAPPALIRIRIVFPDGDPRHWPDIVAAPVREQPGN